VSENPGQKKSSRRALKQYVLGLGIGSVAAFYGVVALAMGETFLPGLKAQGHMVTGRSSTAMALAYVLGGVYLVLRLFVEPRLGSEGARGRLYATQLPLLVGFIIALIYVLMHVGAVQ